MKKYLQASEAAVLAVLNKKQADWPSWSAWHQERLHYLQQERLIHLLVTLFFVSLTLFLFFIIAQGLVSISLVAMLIICLPLTLAYVFHYYYLENTCQRWYKLADQLWQRQYPNEGASLTVKVSSKQTRRAAKI